MGFIRIIQYVKVVILIIVLFTPFHIYSQTERSQYKIIADVVYNEAKPGDSLYLIISPSLHLGSRGSKSYLSVADKNGKVHFSFDQPYEYGYITIKKGVQFKAINDLLPITDNYFWENGDKITFHIQRTDKSDINGYKTEFSGKSSPKYNIINKLRTTYLGIQFVRRQYKREKYERYNQWNFSPYIDTVATRHLLSLLDSVKPQISNISFEAIKTDILFLDQISVLEKLRNIKNLNLPKGLNKDSLINKLKTDYLALINTTQNKYFPSGNLIGLYSSLFFTLNYLNGDFQEINVAKSIVNNTSGEIQESLLTALLTSIGFSNQTKEIYQFVAERISSNNNKVLLNDLKDQKDVDIGKYVLMDVNGSEVSLSTFKGKLLIIDIWFTGCGGCIEYRKNILSKIEQDYQNDNRVQIVSISIDRSLNTWKKSISLDTYTNPNGINLYTGGMADLHPLLKNLGINFMPMPILVDRSGKVIEFDSYRLKDYNLFSLLINESLKK